MELTVPPAAWPPAVLDRITSSLFHPPPPSTVVTPVCGIPVFSGSCTSPVGFQTLSSHLVFRPRTKELCSVILFKVHPARDRALSDSEQRSPRASISCHLPARLHLCTRSLVLAPGLPQAGSFLVLPGAGSPFLLLHGTSYMPVAPA